MRIFRKAWGFGRLDVWHSLARITVAMFIFALFAMPVIDAIPIPLVLPINALVKALLYAFVFFVVFIAIVVFEFLLRKVL